jgi:predicted enzyme related to lactoylglutathione lyase
MSQPAEPQSASAPSPLTPAEAPGRFVWHDLMTTDPARAVPFYEGLFGWRMETRPMEGVGDYTMFHVADEALGGIVPLDPAHGVPSHWISYVSVASVDAACERATALGGTVGVPPTDIPEVGRFAVVGDPGGAHVSPFAGPGAAPERTAPVPDGTMIWHELMTPEPAREREFHAAVFGWSWSRVDMGELGDYWLAERAGAPVAGLMRLPDEAVAAGSGAHWLSYVQVADVDASTARAAELGGTVLVQPHDIPDVGRFAVLRDPAGAPIALMRPLPRPA